MSCKISNRKVKMVQRNLKINIDNEEKFRKELSDEKEKLENRLYAIEVIDKTGNKDIPIMVQYKSGMKKIQDDKIFKTLFKIYEEIGLEKFKSKTDNYITNLEKSIESSFLKEKFMRYSHNFNVEKAEKYHKKIQEKEEEEMEDYFQSHNRGEKIRLTIDGRINDEEDVEASNENAYKMFCDEVKKAYEWRQKVIQTISH